MERPQKRSKTTHARSKTLAVDAATSVAPIRNNAPKSRPSTPSTRTDGKTVVATHGDTLLSSIYADSDINPLTASLVMQRSDTGKDTCILEGYARGLAYSRELKTRVVKIAENLLQGELGGPVSITIFDEMEGMFSKFAQSTFSPSTGRCRELQAFTYGRPVAFFSLAIDIRTATVLKRADGFITIECVVEDADVLDEEFEQPTTYTKDENDYIAAEQAALEIAKAKLEAAKAKQEVDRHLAVEQSEVAHHLAALAKKPIPYLEKRFVARGKAVFTTIKALNMCAPTAQLTITRVDKSSTKVEITGYSRANPYSQDLQDRVDTILLATGLAPPSPNSLDTGFGTTPPRISDQKTFEKFLYSVFLLHKTSSASAIFYSKEVDPLLGILYKPCIENISNNLQALVSVKPDGFISVSISGVVLPAEFHKTISMAMRQIYRKSEGVLGKDEEDFEGKRSEFVKRNMTVDEEAKMAKELEEELMKELEKDNDQGKKQTGCEADEKLMLAMQSRMTAAAMNSQTDVVGQTAVKKQPEAMAENKPVFKLNLKLKCPGVKK